MRRSFLQTSALRVALTGANQKCSSVGADGRRWKHLHRNRPCLCFTSTRCSTSNFLASLLFVCFLGDIEWIVFYYIYCLLVFFLKLFRLGFAARWLPLSQPGFGARVFGSPRTLRGRTWSDPHLGWSTRGSDTSSTPCRWLSWCFC